MNAPTHRRAAALTAAVVGLVLALTSVAAHPVGPSTAATAGAAALVDVAVDDGGLQFATDQLRYCRTLLAAATTSAQRSRGQQCIADAQRAVAWILAHPPTPTPTPTGGPSPSAPPTPTPTPAPPTTTPAPSPSPTTGPLLNCMPVPSACGWPDATNTGTHGTLTVVNGSVTLSTPGMVYADRDVRGCISVRAKDVTIRNVRVTCSATYAIAVNSGPVNDIWWDPSANLLIEDVEINHGGQLNGKGIAFTGYRAVRVWYHNGSDCAHLGSNATVESWFCTVGPDTGDPAVWCDMEVDGEVPHWDGFQSDGGSNLVIRGNTIRVPCGQTSAVLMSTNTAPISNVVVEGNLVAGGGWSVYCATDVRAVGGTEVVRNNRFARTYFTRSGRWGPMAYCEYPNIVQSGNVWDDTGAPL